MKTLRDYQSELAIHGAEKLKQLGIVYYAIQMRVGKSAIALETCRIMNYNRVLFLTRKKAISSIENDYKDFKFNNHFDLVVTNNESLHYLKDNNFEVIVMDEAHRLGGFPKTSKIAKDLKKRFSHLPMIFLSGTTNPESYSQLYNQFNVSRFSPFKEKSFYRWADTYVKVSQRNYGYGMVNDYSNADKDKVNAVLDKYFVTYTQKQAGFETEIKEHILEVDMKPSTYSLANKLIKDRVIESSAGAIIADSGVKLQNKLHQIYSGTIIFEDGTSKVFDLSKAEFIKRHFKDKKIGVFYKFRAEFEAIKEVFADDLTDNIQEFDNTHKNIALQVVSGREGVSLRNAECLVFYSIDFSAVSYFQARERASTINRSENHVYWIFAKSGIEDKIYKAVKSKKNYTLSRFRKDYKI